MTKGKQILQGMKAVNVMGIIICFGALSLSFNLVCMTEIAGILQQKNNLTKQELIFQLSVATSCFNFGTVISPFLYRRYVKYFGQRKGLINIDITVIFITIAQLFVLRYEVLAICRFLNGILLGISTSIIPIYLNSIAPPQVSGKLGIFNQVFQTIGVLFAYTLGTIITNDAKDQIRWRFYIGFPIIFLGLRILGLTFVFPFDSVERHIALNQTQKIKQFCNMMYEDDSQATIQQLKLSKMGEGKEEEYNSTLKTRLTIGIVVIASNQLSGVNGILYYAKQLFFKVTDGKQDFSQILIIQLSLLQVVATLISTQIIDIVGRRKMLVYGQSIICGTLLGVFVFYEVGGKVGQLGILFLIFLHILVINITLGPVCIVYCTQILNDITWIVFTLKGCSLLIALTTEYMIEYLGLGFMFLLFFVLSFIAFLFLQPRILQTAGISRAEAYRRFQSHKCLSPENARLIENQE